MKSVAPHDRPREKLQRLGAAALGDNELVAVVFGSGQAATGRARPGEPGAGTNGGIEGLARARHDELTQLPGIGSARAAQVLAAVELGRRTLTRADRHRVQITSPRMVAELLLPLYGNRPVEQFGVALLDTKHRVMRTTVVTVGTARCEYRPPARDFPRGGRGRCRRDRGVSHHPSGDPEPSDEDVRLTH